MKRHLALVATLLVIVSSCNKKDVSVTKDYTSIVCKMHNERVYRREYRPVCVEYTNLYGLFMHSQDWRAKYPYAVIDHNKDVHAEDETNKYFFHLVCDQCKNGLLKEFQKFDPDTKNYRFDVVLDKMGKPLVEGKAVSIDRLEAMLKDETFRHPRVCVRICVPHKSSVKDENLIVNTAHKAGIYFIRFNRVPIEEYMKQ